MTTRRFERFFSGRVPSRTVVVTTLFAVLTALGAVACGTTDEASRQTLPPLVTTTTSTTTTTTISQDRFYTVQPGDILTVIAAERGVTVQAIVEKNGLESKDDIEAGQVLEIP